MSLTKGAASRLSLLAGSSLVAALAFTGAILAPQAAYAANECAPIGVAPSANGAAADTYACSGAYAGGITYSSAGNLTVNSTGNSSIGAVGINLVGNGADNVTFNATGTLTGTSGPAIDIDTVSGAIIVNTASITANAAGATHAIQATSTGGGDITISRTTGTINVSATTGVAAIEAVTNGGAIVIASAGTTTGRARGIVAQTSGAGSVAITVAGNVTANATDGVAAISATAGTGGLDLIINSGNVNGGAGTAILAASSGGADIDNLGGTVTGSVNFSGVTAGGVTFDNAGATSSAGRWAASGASVFSGGADVVTLSGLGVNTTAAGTSLSFGAGTDTFNMGAVLTVNGLTITGLEAFNNAGVIYMGGTSGTASDLLADDVLTITGGTFTGSGASRIVMDVDFAAGDQAGCSTPTAADCVNLTGAATAGSTLITIRDVAFAFGGGGTASIALVVGSSAQDDFTLDPNSDGFTQTADGPAIRRTLFAYHLVYDAAGHRHVLAGVPTDEAFEGSTFAASAQETWRSAAGSWFDRQADLRATPGGLTASRGLWARAGVSANERDVQASFGQGGTTFAYDVGHSQRTAHMLFGADVLGGSGPDSAWVLGAMAGLVRSDVSYDAAPTEMVYAGVTGGLYASLLAGPLFIDAAFSANVLDATIDAPEMNLANDVKLAQTIKSLGGQIEAGWRIAAGKGVFVEPLAGLSYVRTRLDDIDVAGASGTFDFEDNSTSLRAGAGLRLGVDDELGGHAATYGLTARYWNEFEGGNETTIVGTNAISSALLTDDFSGGFGEIVGALNLYSDSGAVSGFVNLGGKFADGYRSVGASAGLRLRW